MKFRRRACHPSTVDKSPALRELALSNMTRYIAPSYRTIRVHYELYRMITTTIINQIAVVVGNCDFVRLRRALHHGHKHRSWDYQKRQQPKKFFHGFHRGKRAVKGGRMASPLTTLRNCPCAGGSLTFCSTRSENFKPMKKYILSLLGILVAMAFIASCQQEGTTVTEEPDSGSPAYMNRPAPSPTR